MTIMKTIPKLLIAKFLENKDKICKKQLDPNGTLQRKTVQMMVDVLRTSLEGNSKILLRGGRNEL
jgi:hypothetical protein